MSRREDRASSKGMNSLANSPRAYCLSHRIERGEIDFRAEQVAEPVFKVRHRDQGQTLRAIEFRHEVSIGLRRVFAARYRAEQAQVDDSRRLQLRLMPAQRLKYLTPVHTGTLPQMEEGFNSYAGMVVRRSDEAQHLL